MKASLTHWSRPLVVVGLVAALTLTATGSGAASARVALTSWTDTSLHVVAGPVAADGVAVVLVVDPNKTLHLEGVQSNGHVAWSDPYNASYITAGEFLTPVVVDGVTIDLAPATKSTGSGLATVKGIDVATGKVAWTRANIYAADLPTSCEGDTEFCIDVTNSTGYTYSVQVVNPTTGAQVRSQSGLVRTLMPGLFQTTSSTATATVVGPTGARLWTRTFASLFGGPKFDPSGGWEFRSLGGLMIGSVGDIGVPSTTTSEVNVGNDKTIAIDPTTGKVKWSDPGMFECMGTMPTQDPVICKYHGTVHYNNLQPDFAGVSLTIEGFAPATGRITWSKAVTDVAPLSEGESDRLASGHELEVTVAGGHHVLLNLQTGATTGLSSTQEVWCETLNQYTAVAVTGDPYSGRKVGVFRFDGCTGSGDTAVVPTTGSTWFGVQLGTEFVWPSTKGLSAARIPSD